MSFSFLHEHRHGCSPLHPCEHCKATAFLKDKLGEAFDDFITLCGEAADAPPVKPPLNTPIEVYLQSWTGQSKSAVRSLRRAGVVTIEDVLRRTEEELRSRDFLGFGMHALKRLKRKLEDDGYRLGELT